MKRSYRNALLGLIFALGLTLMFISTSYLGLGVKAVESESTETETPEEKPEENEIKGEKYTFKDEKTIQELILSEDFKFKLTITNLETAETVVKTGKFVLNDECYILKVKDTDEQLRVKVDYDAGTFENLEAITKDDVVEEVEGLSNGIKDTIMLLVDIFASLGITWASIATIMKWFKNKTKDANKGLERTKDMLDELKKELKDNNSEMGIIKSQFIEVKQKYNEAIDEIKELKALFIKYIEDDEFKKDKINKVVAEVLDPNNGDE